MPEQSTPVARSSEGNSHGQSTSHSPSLSNNDSSSNSGMADSLRSLLSRLGKGGVLRKLPV